MSTRIQKIARAYLGRRRARGIRLRLESTLKHLSELSTYTRGQDETANSLRNRIALMSGAAEDEYLSEWNMLDAALCCLLTTDKPLLALQLSGDLATRHPSFVPGVLLLLTTLLYVWSGIGKARMLREDMLAEVVEAIDTINRLSLDTHFITLIPKHNPKARFYYSDNDCVQSQLFPSMKVLKSSVILRGPTAHLHHSLPRHLVTADPVSLHENILDELQLTYFAAALRKTHRSCRVVSVLACWTALRAGIPHLKPPPGARLPAVNLAPHRGPLSPLQLKSSPSAAPQSPISSLEVTANSNSKHGTNPFPETESSEATVSARRLFAEALALAQGTDRSCCQRRGDIAENLFERDVELLCAKKVTFKGVVDLRAHERTADPSSLTKKTTISFFSADAGLSLGAQSVVDAGGGIREEDEENSSDDDEDEWGRPRSRLLRRKRAKSSSVHGSLSAKTSSASAHQGVRGSLPHFVPPLFQLRPSHSYSTGDMSSPFSRLRKLPSAMSGDVTLAADVQVFRIGDLLLLRASITRAAPSQRGLMQASRLSRATADGLLSSSYGPAGGLKKPGANKHHQNTGGLHGGAATPSVTVEHFRPLLLLPWETAQLLEKSIRELAQRRGISEGAVRRRGRWQALAEYVAEVRYHLSE